LSYINTAKLQFYLTSSVSR